MTNTQQQIIANLTAAGNLLDDQGLDIVEQYTFGLTSVYMAAHPDHVESALEDCKEALTELASSVRWFRPAEKTECLALIAA